MNKSKKYCLIVNVTYKATYDMIAGVFDIPPQSEHINKCIEEFTAKNKHLKINRAYVTERIEFKN